jgi:hypothetical protein
MKKHYRYLLCAGLLSVFALFAFALWMGSPVAEAKIVAGMQVSNTQPAVLDKDNPQIQAVMAIQDHYSPALLSLPDVVGTATGIDDKGKPAVLVFTKGTGVSGIPTTLDGTPVVVKVTGAFHAMKRGGGSGSKGGFSTTAILTPPVPIGVSTGNENECSAGTIGARVTDGTGNYYALSNNHVYALENDAANYSSNRVLQPGLYDTQCFANGNIIGELSYYIPIDFSGASNIVDAALAEVYRDSSGALMVDKTTPPNGYGIPKSATVSPAVGTSVEKYGRTSQLTVGTITAINATVLIGYSSGTATFTGQIIVQSGKPFIKAGDSGSLLVTSSGLNPVGLMFAGDSSGKYAIANNINQVLTRLSGLTGTTLRIDGNP